MVTTRELLTIADFEAFLDTQGEGPHRYELINGEIVSVGSNNFASMIAGKVFLYIGMYLLNNNIGQITGEAGSYVINGNVYTPDVAYISYERLPEFARQGFAQEPPNLAVEVVSDPANSAEERRLRRKVITYLLAGTVVWVVDPFAQLVEVYEPNQPLRVLRRDDTLTVEAVLPGFALPLSNIFPQGETGEGA